MTARQPLLTRTTRFAVSGVGATIVHVLVAAALMWDVGTGPAIANGAAFLAANSVSYLANTYWSFSQTASGRNLSRFIVTSCIGIALSMLIAAATTALGGSDAASIAAVALLLPPITFALHHFWTYR